MYQNVPVETGNLQAEKLVLHCKFLKLRRLREKPLRGDEQKGCLGECWASPTLP